VRQSVRRVASWSVPTLRRSQNPRTEKTRIRQKTSQTTSSKSCTRNASRRSRVSTKRSYFSGVCYPCSRVAFNVIIIPRTSSKRNPSQNYIDRAMSSYIVGYHRISSCRGTTIDSSTILSMRFSFSPRSLLAAVIGVLPSGEGGKRGVNLGVNNGDPWLDVRCFSSIASAFFRNCSTFSTRLVFFPPRQMKIADAMPQRKLAGIKIPVDHGGRSNLRTQSQSLTRSHERAVTLPVEAPHGSAQNNLKDRVTIVEAAYNQGGTIEQTNQTTIQDLNTHEGPLT